MALFGQRAPSPDTPAPPQRPNLQVLRADGQRIDLSQRDAGALLVATRQGWQADAFSYRDMIGELRFALRLLSRHVARARFYVAEARGEGQDPAPLDGDDHKLDAQLAADALHNFARIPFDGNPDGFTARLVENLSIAGEAWVHIDAQGRFYVRSTSEITASADGRVVLNLLPGGGAAAQRQIDHEQEDLLRCWVPHPEWGQLADSPLRVLRDTCEDVVLAGREQRAAARSRLAANGILFISDAMSLVGQRQDAEDGEEDGVVEDTFMADFTAAVLASIRDDSDPQAVVPIVIRGDKEDIAAARHVTFERADSADLINRQQTGLLRILKGLDIQPEQVEGVGATNHWNAWIIDSRAIRDQVQPTAETVAACLLQAFLRPVLLSLGHPEDAVDRVTIAVDVSPLAENPNRGQDARDAHGAGVISDEALRVALGFDEDDAPSDEEILRRLAATGNLPVGVIATLFGLTQQEVQQAAVVEGQIAEAAPPAQQALPAGTPEPRAQAGPGQVTPTNPVPSEPTQVVAAAVLDEQTGFVVDDDAGRRLADIDAELADRITVAADAALARVIERAGARVRSQAQKDRAAAGAIGGLEAHLIPARLGRERVESFVPVADLLADGYGRLRGQFGRWMAQAAAQVADVVVDLLRLEGARADQTRVQVVSRLEGRTDQAWQTLAEKLDAAAEVALFLPDPLTPDPGPGEPVDTLISPADVEDVLRVAGGGQPVRPSSQTQAPMRADTPGPGGYGTGPDVTALLAEHNAILLGWEWQYRFGIKRDRFAPWHTQLDKLRFPTFTDPALDTQPETEWIGPYYFPGDHAGCRCRVVPIMAVPEQPDPDDDIVARRLREAAADPRNRLADEVAAEDTAAGRVGTSLQNESEVRRRLVDQYIRGGAR